MKSSQFNQLLSNDLATTSPEDVARLVEKNGSVSCGVPGLVGGVALRKCVGLSWYEKQEQTSGRPLPYASGQIQVFEGGGIGFSSTTQVYDSEQDIAHSQEVAYWVSPDGSMTGRRIERTYAGGGWLEPAINNIPNAEVTMLEAISSVMSPGVDYEITA